MGRANDFKVVRMVYIDEARTIAVPKEELTPEEWQYVKAKIEQNRFLHDKAHYERQGYAVTPRDPHILDPLEPVGRFRKD